MRSFLAFLAVVFLVSVVQGKEYLPSWDSLSVTWRKFSSLPMTTKLAIKDGWTKESSSCSEGSFVGYRYILNDDPAVMLLFDAQGNIAGFQTAVLNTTVTPKTQPWNKEENLYVVTVYFTDPKFICSTRQKRLNPDNIGDKLLFQTGKTPKDVMEIPHAEEDIKKQKDWVLGKCFISMGRHYWYKISKSMDCTDFYPFFVMYNGNKLNAFGFVMDSNQGSSRFEHPTPFASKMTFRDETRPRCLDEPVPQRSSIHVYLQRRPYFNFC